MGICTWDSPRQAAEWIAGHPGATVALAASSVAVVVAAPVVVAAADAFLTGAATDAVASGAAAGMRGVLGSIGERRLAAFAETRAGRLMGQLLLKFGSETRVGRALFGAKYIGSPTGLFNSGIIRIGISQNEDGVVGFAIRFADRHIFLWPPP